MFELLAKNPEGVTFTGLFVALLIYVMKTNGEREKNYQKTIDENQNTIRELAKALNTFEDLKEKVESLLKGRV